jgi:hypothetical protein
MPKSARAVDRISGVTLKRSSKKLYVTTKPWYDAKTGRAVSTGRLLLGGRQHQDVRCLPGMRWARTRRTDSSVDSDKIVINWTPNNLMPHRELIKRVSRAVCRAGYPVILTERMGIASNSHMCATAVAGTDPAASAANALRVAPT